ncbi:hypothetical protein Hypma_004441 [Hypsizygus marmoreus]|uniref:Secreted protein n=1 Tax=Hypsizygus marmoreus TaxID=39966 RepID=A0A369K1G3_HYPMA|nr:hypothetical protein Hypma_004441 [Hypsizygus marmoreus]
MYLTLITAVFFSLACVTSLTQAQPPIPPIGLYCCPTTGPNGLTLDRQQTGPYTIFCYYDEGTTQGCFYNPATGLGGGTAGCPLQAPANPHPPTCPI